MLTLARSGYLRAATWLGLAFSALAVTVALGLAPALDLWLGTAARLGSPCWALNLSEAASLLFAGELSLLYAAALALFCVWRGRPLLGAWLIGLLLASVAFEFALKFWLSQPAPDAVLGSLERPDCYRPAYLAYPLAEVPAPNTFPSGYAIRAAFFGLLLARLATGRWPRMAGAAPIGLVLLLGLLGATRLVIAWHWASDVLGGLLLGATLGCLWLAAAAESGLSCRRTR